MLLGATARPPPLLRYCKHYPERERLAIGTQFDSYSVRIANCEYEYEVMRNSRLGTTAG